MNVGLPALIAHRHRLAAFSQRSSSRGAFIRSAQATNAGVAPRQRSVSELSKTGASVRRVVRLLKSSAEIVFDDAQRTIAPASSDLQPAEPTATLSELEMPLSTLIRDTAHAVVEVLGLEQKDVLVEGLATRWQRGTLVMQPADASLQPKEVPLETFFHKIVMIRNNLRVLEQKVNASDKLSEADKFDLQQYITRCYGSLTTFNILFKNKDDQFRTGAVDRPDS